MAKKSNHRSVIVTTEFRGVFYGTLIEDNAPESVTLVGCRNVIRFGTTNGFLQLVAAGPTSDTKLGSIASQVTLYKITSISDVSADAQAKWNAAVK